MKTLKLFATCLVLGMGLMLTGASALAYGNREASPPSASLKKSDKLVAYWKFEEGTGDILNDSSGNGHTGKTFGATWVPGKVGGALRFDGLDDYGVVPNADDLSGWDAFTFEAWVNRKGVGPNWQFVLEKPGNDGCQNGESYNFLWRQVDWRVPMDGDWINSTFSYAYDQGYTLNIAKEPSALDHAWHHFALTYDGATLRSYVDGVPDNQMPASGTVRTTTSPLYIGAGLGWCYMAAFFKGDMDELKIYARARSAGEIAQDAALSVSASVDLSPNTVNLMSHGNWLTAYIELPRAYDPADIELASVRLAGTVPAVTNTKYGWVKNPSKFLTDHDGDGILERMVRFDADAVRAYLKSIGARGMTTLTVSGNVTGIHFEGQAAVKVAK